MAKYTKSQRARIANATRLLRKELEHGDNADSAVISQALAVVRTVEHQVLRLSDWKGKTVRIVSFCHPDYGRRGRVADIDKVSRRLIIKSRASTLSASTREVVLA